MDTPFTPTKVTSPSNGSWTGASQLDRLQNHLLFHQIQHAMAAEYFHHQYLWYDLVPSLLLTMTSSLLALFTENLISNNTLLFLAIGTMTSVATFHKGVAAALKYGTRADMHKTASKSLDDIKDSLERLLILQKSSLHDIQSLEQRIIETIKNCDSIIPLKITSQFDALAARVPFVVGNLDDKHSTIEENPTYLWELYIHELSRSITSHTMWPILIPNCLNQVQHVHTGVEHRMMESKCNVNNESFDTNVSVIPSAALRQLDSLTYEA